MSDKNVVGTLNHTRERAKGAGDRLIAFGEDRGLPTDGVVRWRDVKGFLDIRAIEIIIRTSSQRGEAHLIP